MAFPAIQDADTKNGVQTSNTTSFTLTYPTNLASGNLILAFLATDGAPVFGSPTGWTVKAVIATAANSLAMAAKISDGTETGNFSWPLTSGTEQGGWRVFRITGWFGGSLGTVSTNDADGIRYVTTITGSPSSTPDPPSNSPVWGSADTLWLAPISVDTSRTISAYPLAGRNTADVSGGATGATLGLCTDAVTTATENPGTYTISASDDWAAMTVGVRPASGTTYNQTNAGALTFSGTGPKTTNKVDAGALTFSGLEARLTSKTPAGAVSFVGTPAKVTSKSPAGALTFVGALSKSVIFMATVAGAVSFVGNGARSTLKSIAGALSFVGAEARITFKNVAGVLTFVGDQSRSFLKTISGALSFAGELVRGGVFSRTVSGALAFVGAITTLSFFTKTVSGAVSFAADITKTTLRSMGGALSFAGEQAKATSRAVAGALTFLAPLTEAVTFNKGVSGSATFAGTLAESFIPGGGPGPEPPSATRGGGRRDAF